MPSSLALKRLVFSPLPQPHRPLASSTRTPSASSTMTTRAMPTSNAALGAPSLVATIFSQRCGTHLLPTRSLSHVLNVMDQFMDNPYLSASNGIGAGVRRSWDAREAEDALHLRIDMPGLDKENVKVSVQQNTLVIRGDSPKEFDDGESGGRYVSRIDQPENI